MINALMLLWNDEAGLVVSAELVLIASLAVLAMIIGLSDVSVAVYRELNRLPNAYGTPNQEFRYARFSKTSTNQSLHDESETMNFSTQSVNGME